MSDAATVDDKKLRDLATLVYALQAAGFFVGLTWIIAVIVNYVKRDDVRGTWIESHFDWQIRTFWVGLVAGAIGWILVFVLIGFLVLPVLAIWLIYRIVKGWLALNDRKPLPAAWW